MRCRSKCAAKRKTYYDWLVVSTYPSEKSWSSSVGILVPIYGKIKAMFQTTNQQGSWRLLEMVGVAIGWFLMFIQQLKSNIPNHQSAKLFEINLMFNKVGHPNRFLSWLRKGCSMSFRPGLHLGRLSIHRRTTGFDQFPSELPSGYLT